MTRVSSRSIFASVHLTFDELELADLTQIVSRYANTRLGRQELDAELLEDVPGALWRRETIEQARLKRAALPPLRRIVVAIDPAVSNHETINETGLVVVGLGADDHGHLLEDASGKFQQARMDATRRSSLHQVQGRPHRRRGEPGRRDG
jgi:phage terminase large subunit-like protein